MRHVSSGKLAVPLPAAEAISLFTPEGERVWAPGWDPEYAAGAPSEAPGTVFTTTAHGADTVWVIVDVDRQGGRAAYARITPGHHAGIVEVHCVEAGPGHSTVTVSYDMTLLGDPQSSGFDAYAPERLDEMMHDWSERITAHLQSLIDYSPSSC